MSGPSLDLTAVTTLLSDADGTLFGSEEPAFDASVVVANRCLERLGVSKRYSADELRQAANGLSFRASIVRLAQMHGADVVAEPFRSDVERWVVEENEAVMRHLSAVLQPDPEVSGPLRRLARRFGLAVVSSSARSRIDVSLASTGLADLFPADRRFSAQDSLPVPTSKPDPAVYRWAVHRLSPAPGTAIAVEDAVPGVQSAVAAGLVTVGMLGYVPAAERAQRIAELEDAGVSVLVDSWSELEQLLDHSQPSPVGSGVTNPTPRRAS
ncbi:HAD family hydrolase [uncultured Friedmanniella sp.]|uniref:HAD family hydrolase n=1 Tax=uncultured Friedmanniella sp. TaxID=335381 RepID=UPI0035CC599F